MALCKLNPRPLDDDRAPPDKLKPLTGKKDHIISFSDKLLNTLPQRVLIVDDNADAARSLGMLLEVKGHDCKLVYDSKKALEIAAGYKPGYVFLDLGMPGVDGYALCEQMRALPELSNAVFIAQTGWSDQEYVDRAKRAGFHHHLVKPIDYSEIETILK